ncbi:MAG: ABC transporter substrate-binding protein [Clostridia bacterium]|jgi:iron complex transport system substrate-binding protein
MKKSLRVLSMLLVLVMLLGIISGCTEQKSEQRIVCLAPNMVEVVYALGFGDQIVGWSAYTDYPPEVEDRLGWTDYHYYEYTDAADFDVEAELAKDVAVVSKFYDYNATIVDRLDPTLILGEGTDQEAMCAELTEKGYVAMNFTPTSIADIYDMMIAVGEALGVKKYAEDLVEGYKKDIAEIQAITSTLEPVPVYFEIAHQMTYEYDGAVYTYGPYTEAAGTPFDEMIEIAGGTNLFNDVEGDYIEVTFEDVVARDPAVILSPYWPGAGEFEVTSIYEIMTRPNFNLISAVQTGRVYFYDSSLMKRFGPRTVTAIKKLAYLLHPYYFENPDNSVSPWELGKIDIFEEAPVSLH